MIKTISGIAVTKPSEFLKLAAHNGDLLLKSHFSEALHDTYAFFVNKGEIDPKYFDTTKFADLAPEFGEIEKGSFSIEKLNTLRKMFVNLAKDSSENSYKKYLIDIAIQMEQPEFKILMVEYRVAKERIWKPSNSIVGFSEWARSLAEISGLKHEALVSLYSEKLEERALITARQYADKSGVAWSEGKSRLTDMGMEICELIILKDDPMKK